MTWILLLAATQAEGVGLDQRLGAQVPLDISLRDESGAPVRLGRYFVAKPVILALVYYRCPMLCTQVLNGLLQSLRPLSLAAGEHFEIVVVSFDPRDTPELAAAKKAAYLRQYDRAGAERGWHFLTGDPDQIDILTRAVGFRYRFDPQTLQYAHASGIMVLTPQGRLARTYYGIEYAPRDVRLGLVEAAEGRIGSPADKLLLLCLRYDPVTGRYGFAVMSALRIAAALTVVVLAVFIIRMFRRAN